MFDDVTSQVVAANFENVCWKMEIVMRVACNQTN